MTTMKPQIPLVVLVGPPGAGKSSVGRLIAEWLRTDFTDVDAEIEVTAGKPINEIFIDEGEAYFRQLEERTISRVLIEQSGVVSLGGGAVLSAHTRQRLLSYTVVWLQVGLTDAIQRVGMATDRPVLALNPRATLRHLLEQRQPLYAEVATISVSTDGRVLGEVAVEVLAALKQLGLVKKSYGDDDKISGAFGIGVKQ